MATYLERSIAERWKNDAQCTAAIPGDVILLGSRLIDQAHLDAHYRDIRLMTLLGDDWYTRMIRFASRRPDTAKRVWQYMLEHRRLPRR